MKGDKKFYYYFYRRLGIRIKQARRAKELSQTNLAQMIGCTRTTMVNIERGHQQINVHLIILICNALDLPLQELLNQDNDELYITVSDDRATPSRLSRTL